MRVFLDANILFSAAKTDGAVRHLVRLLLEAGHECWVNEYVVTEARRNLEAKGADTLMIFDALLSRLRVSSVLLRAPALKETGWLAEKDRPVLAAAIQLRCEALVTGDRSHFGAGYGKAFGGVTVYSPRSLAELLLA